MSAAARMVQVASREVGGGSELEIAIRVGLERGYKLSDLLRIHAPDGSAQRLIGDGIEASVRRHVARTKRLPCGEPVRIDPRQNERDTWLAFQFETGTKGDSLVTGASYVGQENRE
jgi:hypothetical protein